MKEEFLIISIVAVIFILSLLGAVVLFKFLKSSALIKKTGYRAGGALAGFILIYGTLYYSFHSLLKVKEIAKWTVVGIAKMEDAESHEGIKIKYVPPSPSTITDASGFFRLENVPSIARSGYPELSIDIEGYFPLPYETNQANTLIENDKMVIRLKDEIKLNKK